ncbi:hypothetical protein N0V88_002367 [Collariella sp. IMI 366227]|nr:hypothetical protein N0V88_002367 [Collariella sp. IMI 366227]
MAALRHQGVTSVQDSQSCIPLSNLLRDDDIILLLTPGIIPEVSPLNRDPRTPPSDPFEPLGRALARHHPSVRHVPYLPRNGITGTHVVHIRLASAVVIVISGPPRHGQPSQIALAEITKSLCEHRPLILFTCCDLQELGPLEKSFPTILEVPSFAPPDLESAADVLFGAAKRPSPKEPLLQNLIVPPRAWPVEIWPPNRDVTEILDLWHQCIPHDFHLNRYQFEALLRRDGYAMHYVVREPGTAQVLGFCATYTTYADSGGERLLGSLAVLIVRQSYRQRGVGTSLHSHALRQLTKLRGICRLQLGSTFPRLLYGLPIDSLAEEWFQRRGWSVKPPPLSTTPPPAGTGQEVSDWLLKFKDWPAITTNTIPTTLTFRPCEFTEFDMVLGFVEKEARKKDHMGWYDQYAKLAGTVNIRDIVLGLEEGVVVAVALTYVGVGEPDEVPNAANKRDAVMIRLLDTCIRLLAEQGMDKMLIDAVKGGDEGFQSMGEWSRRLD